MESIKAFLYPEGDGLSPSWPVILFCLISGFLASFLAPFPFGYLGLVLFAYGVISTLDEKRTEAKFYPKKRPIQVILGSLIMLSALCIGAVFEYKILPGFIALAIFWIRGAIFIAVG